MSEVKLDKNLYWLLSIPIALVIIIADVPTLAIAGGTFAICFIMWLAYKRKVAKEALELDKKDPAQESEMKRMRERLENLEGLMCRLDLEINSQLERSLGRILTANPSASGVSQLPTAFMNVATALESRYQILKELGRGGMGIVFQAYDKQLKEHVAIKVLSPLLSHDSEALERMKREVSAARRITHSNIIRIFDLSEINGLQYVSMEYFQGTSLKDYIKKHGSLSFMQAYQIACQICDGLQEAHRQGIIHRDLKSQNIIINEAAQLKIIDFGLARTTHMEGMTATGLIMGTPEYMAPEQVAGKRVDERADIYALGIILYEIFTGSVPFTGDSAIAVGFKQMKDDPPLPHEKNPQIPLDVEKVILKALQKDPINRYRTVSDLKEELEKAAVKPAPSQIQESSTTLAPAERIKS